MPIRLLMFAGSSRVGGGIDRGTAVVAVALLVAGLARAAEPSPPDGSAIYALRCASCHGHDGAGAGPVGRNLDPAPADFTTAAFWATRDEQSLVAAIAGGGPAVGRSPLMPAWEAVLAPGEVQAVVDYVRATYAPAEPDPSTADPVPADPIPVDPPAADPSAADEAGQRPAAPAAP